MTSCLMTRMTLPHDLMPHDLMPHDTHDTAS